MDNRWAMLAVLVVVRIAMGFQFQAVASVGPLLAADLGLSHAAIGTLAGLYLLPGAVLAIPLGMFASRFDDKSMIALGVGLMAVGGVLTGLADSFAGIAVGRTLAGLGGVLQGIFVVKTLADWFEGREVATAMGIMLSGWPVGIALALLALSPLAESAGWQAAMHASAGLCVLALVVLLALYRPVAATGEAGELHPAVPPRREMLLVLAGGSVWTVYNVAYICYLTFGPVLFVERGLSVMEAGFAVSASSWASMIAVPLGGYLADRLQRPRLVVGLSCLAAALCFLALPSIQAPYLLSILLGFVAAAPAGVLMATVTGVMQPRYRAQGNGIFYAVFYGGMGIAPALAGWSADLSGTASAPIYLAAMVLLATLPLFLVFSSWAGRSRPLPAAG